MQNLFRKILSIFPDKPNPYLHLEAYDLKSFAFKGLIPLYLLAVLVMVFLDKQLIAIFGPSFSGYWRDLARSTTDFGMADQYLIPFIAGWISLELVDRHSKSPDYRLNFLRNWFVNAISAMVVSGILLHLIKFPVGRHRPYTRETTEVLVFTPFSSHWDFHSFPSGHAQTVFCVATMLTMAWPRQKWIWYIGATLLALTRVITLNHYPSDVIAGAALGVFGAKLSVYWLSNTRFKMDSTAKVNS